jgi:membrane protease YdiL (CAAX protease family)
LFLCIEILTIFLCWGFLTLQGKTWSDVGLGRMGRFRILLPVAVLSTALLIAATQLLLPLALYITGRVPDLHAFRALENNTAALLAGLVIVWTVAAFGEEMLFRGFLLNMIYRLLPGGDKRSRMNWITALAASSILFGCAHAYQGPAGMIMTGCIGFGFGIIYLLTRRNLWPSILTHGLYDTVGFISIYLGHVAD